MRASLERAYWFFVLLLFSPVLGLIVLMLLREKDVVEDFLEVD